MTILEKYSSPNPETLKRQHLKGAIMRYSAFEILKQGLSGNKGWKPVWREPEPKAEYDVIIVGGGGHGLSTAYYLSKVFGMRNIAVLE